MNCCWRARSDTPHRYGSVLANSALRAANLLHFLERVASLYRLPELSGRRYGLRRRNRRLRGRMKPLFEDRTAVEKWRRQKLIGCREMQSVPGRRTLSNLSLSRSAISGTRTLRRIAIGLHERHACHRIGIAGLLGIAVSQREIHCLHGYQREQLRSPVGAPGAASTSSAMMPHLGVIGTGASSRSLMRRPPN